MSRIKAYKAFLFFSNNLQKTTFISTSKHILDIINIIGVRVEWTKKTNPKAKSS